MREIIWPHYQWCQGGEALFPIIQSMTQKKPGLSALPSPLERITIGLLARHIHDCSLGVPPICKTDCALQDQQTAVLLVVTYLVLYNKQIVWKSRNALTGFKVPSL